MADGRVERWLRPRYVFPALGLLLALAVLTSPESAPANDGQTYLTTYRGDDWGARGLYEMFQRLSVHTERRITPFRAPLDTNAIYAVLAPPYEPSAREMSALLDAVRRGAALVVVPEPGSVFADSLGVEQSHLVPSAMAPVTDSLFGRQRTDTAARGGSFAAAMQLFTGEGARAFHYWLQAPTPEDSLHALPLPPDTVTLLVVRGARETHPAIVGRRIGRGRVLLLADPGFLRNGVLRRGDAAVLAVRLLEWVDPTHAMPVVFDEYHHGYGRHANLLRTIFDGLAGSDGGHVVLQAAVAALILLLAVSVRPIAPVARAIIERRSPLEHVGAASRAYAAVGATRLATRRLVRGLRRRHPLGAVGALGDDAYLDRLRRRVPALADDAALLARATREPLAAGEFVRAGAAIEHIERTLTS